MKPDNKPHSINNILEDLFQWFIEALEEIDKKKNEKGSKGTPSSKEYNYEETN